MRQADGSTVRANEIAAPDERAGITCYLINGVCHQAANRILLPAGITVNGVRGYPLSNALYGTYGRATAWPCRAPFHQHTTTTGDLPECVAVPTAVSAPTRADLDKDDLQYLAGVLTTYQEFDHVFVTQVERDERENFHLQMFAEMVDFYLGADLGDRRQELIEVRRNTEQRQQEVEKQVTSDEPMRPDVIEEVNDLTLDFQANLAQVTTDDEYERLLQLPKEERIVLADPHVTGYPYG